LAAAAWCGASSVQASPSGAPACTSGRSAGGSSGRSTARRAADSVASRLRWASVGVSATACCSEMAGRVKVGIDKGKNRSVAGIIRAAGGQLKCLVATRNTGRAACGAFRRWSLPAGFASF